MRKFRARWRNTGHGEEVQGTVEKYRGPWRSIGHGGEVQGTVRHIPAKTSLKSKNGTD